MKVFLERTLCGFSRFPHHFVITVIFSPCPVRLVSLLTKDADQLQANNDFKTIDRMSILFLNHRCMVMSKKFRNEMNVKNKSYDCCLSMIFSSITVRRLPGCGNKAKHTGLGVGT